jgi:type VI secretion system protein ImpA
MSLRDELLKPIPGANPGGVDLRYDPLYDKIKEARREDDDAPQGEWATARKVADWPNVIKLSKEALATKSKDLQLAAWLTEALLRREGFAGLNSGLDLLVGLVGEQWDHIFPEIDDGDTEMRASSLGWLGSKMDLPVQMTALDRSGFTFVQHRDARTIPTEAAAGESNQSASVRQSAIEAGKPTPEQIEAAFTATPKAWLKSLVADIDGSLSTLQKLDALSEEKFGDAAPSYSRLRDAIAEVQRTAAQQLKRKLELDPDPVELTAVDAAPGTSTGSAPAGGGALAPEPTSRDDATARIVSAARYLRRNDPFNPAAYLLLRGLRWGELRAAADLDPKLLEAPPTNVRTALKGLLLDSKWPELLEACEAVMGTGQGRGWLDLQRYALTACDALGSDYFAVGTAMRGALRSLLADLPQLLDMTLMDDTPTANVETRNWLRSTIVREHEAASPAPEGESPVAADAPDDNAESRIRDPFALATAEARAGRVDRAISLLTLAAAREKTARGRFLVHTQLAKIMVDAGHEAIATPILEQLIAAVDSHQLEQWESGELAAAPMTLMYRVLTKTQEDEATRQNLYLRICKLDPIQAISLSQS